MRIVLENEAKADLGHLIAAGGRKEAHARRIVALLQEISNSPTLLAELQTEGYETDDFDVKKFQELWHDHGLNVWRLKVWDFMDRRREWRLIPYRVFYAFDRSSQVFRVLGVIPRKIAFDTTNELVQRICETYKSLGLPVSRVTHFGPSGRDKPH